MGGSGRARGNPYWIDCDAIGFADRVRVFDLNDTGVQVRLAEGSLVVRLRRLDDSESFEVDTPNMAFSLLRPGEYRIDADPNAGTTTVTVRGGEGEVTGGNQAFPVHARQLARVTGFDTLTFDTSDIPPARWMGSLVREPRYTRGSSGSLCLARHGRVRGWTKTGRGVMFPDTGQCGRQRT